jgi:hypothetical protein
MLRTPDYGLRTADYFGLLLTADKPHYELRTNQGRF